MIVNTNTGKVKATVTEHRQLAKTMKLLAQLEMHGGGQLAAKAETASEAMQAVLSEMNEPVGELAEKPPY